MIRFATRDDIDKLQQFINDHWKENHILARDREFFEYEHCDGDKVNFIISLDDDGNINGMQGFIPYGRENRDITKNLWRALKCNVPHLGSKILDFLIENSDARSIASIGSNPSTMSIYKRIGYTTGELIQWYRLNPEVDYILTDISNAEVPQGVIESFDWIELKTMDDFNERFDYSWYENSGMIPIKEKWYIKKRYFNHPIYSYSVFGVINSEGQIRLALVFRVEECNGSKALRLIDCIGDYNGLYHATERIDELLRHIGAEYVDIYESGVNRDLMHKAGWRRVLESGNIIPNYYSPYLRENIQMCYASSEPSAVYFKGDGDQDRPT